MSRNIKLNYLNLVKNQKKKTLTFNKSIESEYPLAHYTKALDYFESKLVCDDNYFFKDSIVENKNKSTLSVFNVSNDLMSLSLKDEDTLSPDGKPVVTLTLIVEVSSDRVMMHKTELVKDFNDSLDIIINTFLVAIDKDIEELKGLISTANKKGIYNLLENLDFNNFIDVLMVYEGIYRRFNEAGQVGNLSRNTKDLYTNVESQLAGLLNLLNSFTAKSNCNRLELLSHSSKRKFNLR